MKTVFSTIKTSFKSSVMETFMMNNTQWRRRFNCMMLNWYKMEFWILDFGLKSLISEILTPTDNILIVWDQRKQIRARITWTFPLKHCRGSIRKRKIILKAIQRKGSKKMFWNFKNKNLLQTNSNKDYQHTVKCF